jgi:hypothetical protein
MSEIISRKDAKLAGLKRYFTGEACPRGHVAERFVSTCSCTACNLENNSKPENRAARDRWKASDHGKARQAEGIARWNAENPEKVKAKYRRYYERNREAMNDRRKENREANANRDREYMSNWRRENRDICNAHARRRFATERQSATYIESERAYIAQMYEDARGLGLQVDHIIPQTHKDVTGLHCLLNLRLIGAEKNNRKNNKFDPDRAHLCDPIPQGKQ